MLDGQLSLDVAAGGEREYVSPADIQTVGDRAGRLQSAEGIGWMVLEQLNLSFGWSVAVMPPFAGAVDDEGTDGILISLTHRLLPGVEIRVVGRDVDDCMPRLKAELDLYREPLAAAAAADRRDGESERPATASDHRCDAHRLEGPGQR